MKYWEMGNYLLPLSYCHMTSRRRVVDNIELHLLLWGS